MKYLTYIYIVRVRTIRLIGRYLDYYHLKDKTSRRIDTTGILVPVQQALTYFP